MAPTAEEWIAQFAEALGRPAPDAAQVAAVLELASVAAHSSERRAAPIACWLAARAGATPPRRARWRSRSAKRRLRPSQRLRIVDAGELGRVRLDRRGAELAQHSPHRGLARKAAAQHRERRRLVAGGERLARRSGGHPAPRRAARSARG